MGGTLNAAIRTPDGKIHRTHTHTSMIQDLAHRIGLMEDNPKCFDNYLKDWYRNSAEVQDHLKICNKSHHYDCDEIGYSIAMDTVYCLLIWFSRR